jgi:hypothetical protein
LCLARRVYGILHIGFLIFLVRLLTDKRGQRLPYRLNAQSPLALAESSLRLCVIIERFGKLRVSQRVWRLQLQNDPLLKTCLPDQVQSVTLIDVMLEWLHLLDCDVLTVNDDMPGKCRVRTIMSSRAPLTCSALVAEQCGSADVLDDHEQ